MRQEKGGYEVPVKESPIGDDDARQEPDSNRRDSCLYYYSRQERLSVRMNHRRHILQSPLGFFLKHVMVSEHTIIPIIGSPKKKAAGPIPASFLQLMCTPLGARFTATSQKESRI